jgi:hypothetical protein
MKSRKFLGKLGMNATGADTVESMGANFSLCCTRSKGFGQKWLICAIDLLHPTDLFLEGQIPCYCR